MPEATLTPTTGGDILSVAQPSTPPAGASTEVQPSGVVAGTTESPSLQSSGANVDLDTLFADPKVQEYIERKFVKPAVTKVSANREKMAAEIEQGVRQRLSMEQLQAQQESLIRQASNPDARIASEAKVKLGELALVNYQQQQNLTNQATARKQMETELARSLATSVFGVPDDQIPQTALESPDALADWAIAQSPRIKAAIEAALKQANSDAKVVDAAAQAAQFGARLQGTPSPNFGTGSAGSGDGIVPMTQVEFDRIRTSPDLRRDPVNAARIQAGVRARTITH